MLRGNIGLVVLARQAEALLHNGHHERCERELGVLRLGLRGSRRANIPELLQDVIVGNLQITEGLSGNALLLLGEREQQMLGAHLGGLEGLCLLLGKRHDLARAVGESV